MLRILCAVLLALLVVTPAQAAVITIEWYPAVGASSFDIEQSVFTPSAPGSQTGTFGPWGVAKIAVPVSACTGTPVLCTTTLTPLATGLVIFRIISINAQGRTIRTEAGFWYDETRKLPAPVSGAGIQ